MRVLNGSKDIQKSFLQIEDLAYPSTPSMVSTKDAIPQEMQLRG